jgi:hypothetical protein
VEITKDFNIGSKTLVANNYATSAASKVYWRIDGNGHTLSGQTQPLLWSSAGNCVIQNLHIVSAMRSTVASCAAFVGYAKLVYGDVLIENCTVNGIVQSDRSGSSQNGRGVGGMVGLVGGTDGRLVIRNCESLGTVNGNGFVGGMLGYAADDAIVEIVGCANKGTVKGRYAGGIVGHVNTDGVTVSDCYSTGTVEQTTLNILDGDTHFGGILGYASKNVIINNSYTTFSTLAPSADEAAVLSVEACYVGSSVTNAVNQAAIDAITLAAHAHQYENKCATICSVTGCVATRKGGHVTDGPCDTVCDRCGGATGLAGHQFDNECDPTCNVEGCDYVGEAVGHSYDTLCDATCKVCGAVREVGEHAYDGEDDPTCNICNAVRVLMGDENDAVNNGAADGTSTMTPTLTTTVAPKMTAAPSEKVTETSDKSGSERGCKAALQTSLAPVLLAALLGTVAWMKKKED